VLYRETSRIACAAAAGTPDALLYVSGTPGFGLVPDGVSAVTVTYPNAPPRTVAVHRNFFVIVAPSQKALPCGVQWLQPTGNVKKIVYGCSYVTPEAEALSEYRGYVAGKLATLQSQVGALAAAIGSGNLAQAQSAWLSAHLTWLEIGQDDGAYGCFGALGGEIDGLAAGHPLGTSDPGFTGFHRIEFDLWSKRDLSAAGGDTATLERLLGELVKVPLSSYLPASATGIGNWLLRPHEVLEDALRDSLTADDDYGSGTDLASIGADVVAVRELLGLLGPVLNPLAPGLVARATGELNALSGAIAATRVNGGWVSIADLPIRQRQQVDADVDAALETLAPLPDLLTSTGANAPTS
jgi:iron uptake system EfeUOB component EfeO/EfeM